jgi:hypothetical protein
MPASATLSVKGRHVLIEDLVAAPPVRTPGRTLDLFVEDALREAGIWDGRSSDGLQRHRVVETGPDRVRLIARMWEVTTQEVMTFWLDLAKDPAKAVERHAGYVWTLHFDIVAASPHKGENAFDLLERPEDANWHVTLSGRASAGRDGLRIDEGSVEIQAQPGQVSA